MSKTGATLARLWVFKNKAPKLRSTPLLAGLFALSISACQPAATDAQSTTNSSWSCQTQDQPFSYSACQIATKTVTQSADSPYSLQLFWQQAERSQPLLTFDTLIDTLPAEQHLIFAMNAGMYNEAYAPIGYTVIAGEERRALNTKEGGGNFHLLPNGVLWWDKAGKIHITESKALKNQLKTGQAQPWYATQSGPMLVIDGDIHPQFNPDSRSLKQRNGVGICADGSIQFVNSDEPVSFYDFATLFKNDLGCANALFLDGGIASALYAPNIDKHDKKQMGVMIGVIETKDN